MTDRDDHATRDALENHVDGVLPDDARAALRVGGAERLRTALATGRSHGLDRLARDAVAAVAAARAALAAGHRPERQAALDRARARLRAVRRAALG